MSLKLVPFLLGTIHIYVALVQPIVRLGVPVMPIMPLPFSTTRIEHKHQQPHGV
jgi:hypothetical protein